MRPRPIPKSRRSSSRTNSPRANRREEAVHAALGRLRGAFALVYLFEGEENLLIGARQGAPLAIGYGDGEMYLGSDALALAPSPTASPISRKATGSVLTREGADIREASGKRVKRRIQRSPAGSLLAEKGNYRHFMAKEIHEQPEVVGHTLARYIDMAALKLKPFAWPADPRQLKRVTIVGCGTAYMAGLVAKYWIERWARLPVEIDVASEYRYREAPVDDGGLTIVVSQSGETADTLASLRYVKERGAKTVGVVNVPDSSIARLTDAAAPTLAGPEIGVASTKAFTCQLAALAALAIGLARRAGRSTRPPRRRWSANSSRRPVFSPRRSSSSPRPRSSRMRSRAPATCSISAAARPIRWRSKAR